MLSQVQQGLERLYRVESSLDVDHFVIDEEARDAAGVARSPREQLLVQEDEDGLFLGLFVDPAVMRSLDGVPAHQLVQGRVFGNFMLVVEGVSHFVYMAFKASAEQPVSALELELQAEVDKYVTCLLSSESSAANSGQLRRRLYHEVEYDEELEDHELERYQVANANAMRYSQSLEARFVRQKRIFEMLRELRRFYRMSLPRKLEHIRRAG
jgi:hypothetical protein